jgi:hypothetical protein
MKSGMLIFEVMCSIPAVFSAGIEMREYLRKLF